MAKPGVLLIARGDLPCLASLSIQNDPARVLLWHPLEGDESAPRRLGAVQALADQFGTAEVIQAQIPPLGLGDVPLASPLSRAVLLITAAAVARELGCRRLVWPITVGGSLEAMETEIDRAGLLSALMTLGESRSEVELDLPLVDLSDEQVLDLVIDQGLPPGSFWPCQGGREEPCGRCSTCIRWQHTATTIGVDWPWAPVMGTV